MPNINISKLQQLSAPQKSYLWKVEFNQLPDVGVDPGTDLSLHAQTSQMPGKEISTIERNWQAHTIQYPGKGTNFGSIDVDFFMHSVDVYHFFVEWGQLIENNQTGLGDSFSNIIANLSMVLLDHQGEGNDASEQYECELKFVWPTNPANDLDFDYSDEGEAGPHTVSLAYSDFNKKNL
jgi:hypothetical protein